MVVMDSLKLTTCRGVLQRFFRNVYRDQTPLPSLAHCLTFFSSRYICQSFFTSLCPSSGSPRFLPLTRLLQSSCRKRSRARYGAASQWLKHALITPLPPPLPHWNIIDPATIHACCQLWGKKKKQKTKTGLCLWMLAGFNQQEVLWLEAVRIRSIKAQSSFVCTIQKDFNPMLIAFFWWTERDCLWSAIVVQHARPHLTLCIRQHLKKTHILKIQTSVDGLIRRGNCALIRCFWSKAVWFFSTPKALLFIPACVVSVLVDQRDAGREIWEDIQAHLLGSFLWDYPECGF